jgi:phosphohistidine phosphatase
MNIYLMRHGIAAERARSSKDSDRPLTRKGESRTWAAAEALKKKLKVRFDGIISSPLLRARQTAEIMADAFDLRKRLEFTETLSPGGDSRLFVAFVNRLAPAPGHLLVVGHEPDLSELASLLVAGDRSLQITLKKGGLCKLCAPLLRPARCASLEWLLTARQMLAMTRSK